MIWRRADARQQAAASAHTTAEPAPLPGASPEEEANWRERLETTGATLRERFDEPIERATAITRRTLAWFPIRVWRRFLQHNGFLLAAGISYQSLFAIFAAIYLAFAIVGYWLGASPEAVDGLIQLINSYIPNLIADDGLIKPADVQAVASSSGSALLITGAVAFIVAIWTAIGFITYTRRAVRDIFGLPYDSRSYLLLKARDLLAALVFGAAILVGWVLGQVTTWALSILFVALGLGEHSIWWQLLLRALSFLVAFGLNAAALAALFKFLSGTSLRWRTIWPGSLAGGVAMAILQVAAGLLLSYTPSNPLLATFAVLIGFLLWFRFNGIVILVAAAWIAITAKDRDIPLVTQSEDQRRAAEHAALVLAAQVRLREATTARDTAPWWRTLPALRRVHAAQSELERVTHAAPPPAAERVGLWDG